MASTTYMPLRLPLGRQHNTFQSAWIVHGFTLRDLLHSFVMWLPSELRRKQWMQYYVPPSH